MIQKLKNIYHLLTALTFQFYYGFPSKKLKVIGITGTDGKTTTSSMVYHALKATGRKVSVITSVAANIGGVAYDTGFHVTTPDPQDIPKYMAKSVKNGDEYFVLEITSHALDQHRAEGVKFEVSGITNVTHEHLGYHKSFDDYIAAKAQLVKLSKLTIVNGDQEGLLERVKLIAKNSRIKTFGLSSEADYRKDIEKMSGVYLENFNKYNALLAYAICIELGISETDFMKALKTYEFPPGRMEEVYKGDFVVVSDFAHTPNALAQALPAVVSKYGHLGRLIHVFGAAAHRDDSKRADMGRSSAASADIVILTEEDYRTEDPERIFSMISVGLHEKGFGESDPELANVMIPNKSYIKVLDRNSAINRAISMAQKGDIVMITGKAQEKSLCRGNVEYPYDEKESIRMAIQNRTKTN